MCWAPVDVEGDSFSFEGELHCSTFFDELGDISDGEDRLPGEGFEDFVDRGGHGGADEDQVALAEVSGSVPTDDLDGVAFDFLICNDHIEIFAEGICAENSDTEGFGGVVCGESGPGHVTGEAAHDPCLLLILAEVGGVNSEDEKEDGGESREGHIGRGGS